MSIKTKLYYKWIKFLSNARMRIDKILEDQNRPLHMPVHPITSDEWFLFDYEGRNRVKRTHYLEKLETLRADVRKTILFNNGKLTHSQVMELEDIKRNLRLLK